MISEWFFFCSTVFRCAIKLLVWDLSNYFTQVLSALHFPLRTTSLMSQDLCMLYFYFNLIPKIFLYWVTFYCCFTNIFSHSFYFIVFVCITIFHLNLHEHYEVMEATDALHANNLIHIFKEDTSGNVAFSSFHQFFCKCYSTEFSPKMSSMRSLSIS